MQEPSVNVLGQALVSGVTVGLHITPKIFKHYGGVLATPSRLIAKKGLFSQGIMVCPEVSQVGSALFLVVIQYLDGGLVDLQVTTF